jgi:general secretion pathway protein K
MKPAAPNTQRLRTWLRRQLRCRQEGVALISVLLVLTLLATSVADFAYNSEVDLSGASNARDDLRAHYLARSGINLARILLRVQEKLIDPNMKMLGGFDLQIADYAPLLMAAFNDQGGAAMLGSLLGVDTGNIKGLGVDTGTFDMEMESLDGKLNLNCGGGVNTGAANVTQFAASLAAMFLPIRYNRLFEYPDERGQYADRLEVMRAIIDWADQDTVIFGGSGPEDYRYNAGKDPYENKNQYYDTLEELRLVKGVSDDFIHAFGTGLTVFGNCKINANLATAPVLAALIMQYAASPSDPGLQWQNLSLVVRYVMHLRELTGGFMDDKAFQAAIESPQAAASLFGMQGSQADGQSLPPVNGIKMNATALKQAVVVGGPRRIWQLTATAKVGRIQKKIRAVWDVAHISMQSSKQQMGSGGFVYWREE